MNPTFWLVGNDVKRNLSSDLTRRRRCRHRLHHHHHPEHLSPFRGHNNTSRPDPLSFSSYGNVDGRFMHSSPKGQEAKGVLQYGTRYSTQGVEDVQHEFE